MKQRISYLDGLRGVAVLLVLFNHHRLFNAGWIGVDLFFVLSGYLITRILRETSTKQHWWKEFWIKRAFRIIPPQIPLFALTILFGYTYTRSLITGYTLSCGDYLAYHYQHMAEPLRITWSLAIEEHFYIAWPFAVRFLKRNRLIQILLLVLLLEIGARFTIGWVYHPPYQFFYYLTPFRLDGLALGSLLALFVENEATIIWLKRFSLPGLGSVLVCTAVLRVFLGKRFTPDDPTPFYVGTLFTLTALMGFFLIAFLETHPKGRAAKLLSWRPLSYLGLISYGVYVYQLLIIEPMMRGFQGSKWAAMVVDLSIIVVVASISFFLYEVPLMRYGRLLSQPSKDHATVTESTSH
jgi:peptidoglycan/LPS O-acetylase OafA/YrhL